MARGGVIGGAQPDPAKGTPHRHTRQKAQLLMDSWGEGELAWLRLRLAMNYLLDKRPEDTWTPSFTQQERTRA